MFSPENLQQTGGKKETSEGAAAGRAEPGLCIPSKLLLFVMEPLHHQAPTSSGCSVMQGNKAKGETYSAKTMKANKLHLFVLSSWDSNGHLSKTRLRGCTNLLATQLLQKLFRPGWFLPGNASCDSALCPVHRLMRGTGSVSRSRR